MTDFKQLATDLARTAASAIPAVGHPAPCICNGQGIVFDAAGFQHTCPLKPRTVGRIPLDTDPARLEPGRFATGHQSHEYEAFWTIAGQRVRIQLKRDSFDFQSYARAAVWSPVALQWNPLVELHYSTMHAVSAGGPFGQRAKHDDFAAKAFADDESELVRRAVMILGGAS